MIYFYGLVCFIIMQRLIELYIAHKNEHWMKARGGIEVGREHYKWFVWLHIAFFVFMLLEFHYHAFVKQKAIPFYFLFFILFVIAQAGRIWCIHSLGKFWNTKIIVLPKVALIKKGPYKYMKHPNYVIVFIELLVIPLMFGLYLTAYIFPFLHLLLLTVRIPMEEEALDRSTSMK
ncbi:MAG: hypothetical protein GX374_08610 [Bacilli bacterium]|nr:hypothetical protein [Bacilli bacterium]